MGCSSHSAGIMQEIIFSPVIFYIEFVFCVICIEAMPTRCSTQVRIRVTACRNFPPTCCTLEVDLRGCNETRCHFQCSILAPFISCRLV